MNSFENPEINPNPVLPIGRMTGTELSESLALLASRSVDSLVIDNLRYTSISHRREAQDGRVHVECDTDDGMSILFIYDPTDHIDPVQRFIVPPSSYPD